MEHLVEGHLGSYYISDDDPEFIEQYCETCGDSDTILISWNQEEENARVNALLRYFMANNMNTREDIYSKVSLLSEWGDGAIITLLLNEIKYNNEEVFNIVFSLYENKDITKKEFDTIIHISDFEEERQRKMVKYFEKSIDDKTGEKVLKKKI